MSLWPFFRGTYRRRFDENSYNDRNETFQRVFIWFVEKPGRLEIFIDELLCPLCVYFCQLSNKMFGKCIGIDFLPLSLRVYKYIYIYLFFGFTAWKREWFTYF